MEKNWLKWRTTSVIKLTLKMRVFVSHASEDKSEIAAELSAMLRELGFSVWYDEYSLKPGDRLRQSIDRGLAECDFGVVIFSHHFFSKNWPREELEGLTTREISEDRKVVIPVWHKISLSDVTNFSPSLASRFAISSSVGIEATAFAIRDAITSISLGKSSFAEPTNEARAKLQDLMSGQRMEELGAFVKMKDNALTHGVYAVHAADGFSPSQLKEASEELKALLGKFDFTSRLLHANRSS